MVKRRSEEQTKVFNVNETTTTVDFIKKVSEPLKILIMEKILPRIFFPASLHLAAGKTVSH